MDQSNTRNGDSYHKKNVEEDSNSSTEVEIKEETEDHVEIKKESISDDDDDDFDFSQLLVGSFDNFKISDDNLHGCMKNLIRGVKKDDADDQKILKKFAKLRVSNDRKYLDFRKVYRQKIAKLELSGDRIGQTARFICELMFSRFKSDAKQGTDSNDQAIPKEYLQFIRVCHKRLKFLKFKLPNYVISNTDDPDAVSRRQTRSSKAKEQESIDKENKLDTEPMIVEEALPKTFILDQPSSTLIKFDSYWYDPVLPNYWGLAFNPYCYPQNYFAVCGAGSVVVYHCLDTLGGGNRLKPVFTHNDKHDCYYTCCWALDYKRPDHQFLIIGGESGIIRVIDVYEQSEIKTIRGHGAAINDLKISPLDPRFLLSASADFSIRLWNLESNICVAIFGGVQGHRDQVLCVDFHRQKPIFASVSIDHSVKLWSLLDKDVDEAIQLSKCYRFDLNGKQFPTVTQNFPNYSTRNVHHNYVDCVKWFGDSLITKSCNEEMIMWRPRETLDDIMRKTHHNDIYVNESKELIMKRFQLVKNNLWFVKFDVDLNDYFLAIGNHRGQLYIYDLKYTNTRDYRLAFCLQTPKVKQPPASSKMKPKGNNVNRKTIRQTAFSPDGSILITLSENSCVCRYDLVRVTKIKLYLFMMSTQLLQSVFQKWVEDRDQTKRPDEDEDDKELIRKYLKFEELMNLKE